MPRTLLELIEEELLEVGESVLKNDRARKLGVKPRMRIVAALRTFAPGLSFDDLEEIFEMAESTCGNIFFVFVTVLVKTFEKQYLHLPNDEDQRRILAIMNSRGFLDTLVSGTASFETGKVVQSLGQITFRARIKSRPQFLKRLQIESSGYGDAISEVLDL